MVKTMVLSVLKAIKIFPGILILTSAVWVLTNPSGVEYPAWYMINEGFINCLHNWPNYLIEVLCLGYMLVRKEQNEEDEETKAE